MLDINKLHRSAIELIKQYPSQRSGQAIYNCMSKENCEIFRRLDESSISMYECTSINTVLHWLYSNIEHFKEQ